VEKEGAVDGDAGVEGVRAGEGEMVGLPVPGTLALPGALKLIRGVLEDAVEAVKLCLGVVVVEGELERLVL
jgi:hypothetical protein